MNSQTDKEAMRFEAPLPSMLQRIAYLPLYAMFFCIAKLPAPVVRMLSAILTWLAKDVVKYRRRLVNANLAKAFPALDKRERKKIAHKFYLHLAQYFFQTVSFRWMNENKIKRHVEFMGVEIFNKLLEEGKNVIFYTSHFGNWEYITPMSLWMPRWRDKVIFAHVNRPLKNKWFNRFYWKMRSRYNVSVPMHQTVRTLLEWKRTGHQFITGFLADQKASHHSTTVGVDFLGIETQFMEGPEQLARKLKAAAVYCDMSMPANDKYRIHIKLLTSDASQLKDGELTQMYASALTRTIKRQPALYLWSHNRWRINKKNL